MGISSLATKYGFQSFPHYTNGRSGAKIDKIVIHHMATTNYDVVPSCWNTRQASAHYGIGKNGEIRAYVDENNTAWHAGNWSANTSSIGIEHCNSTGSPEWGVTDATVNASVRLCADIAKRYGLGKLVVNKNLFPHNYFAATSCPGKLQARMQEIADKANALNADSATTSTQSSNPSTDLTAVAKRVIAGEFGNGADRKKKLEAQGYNYSQVQAIVNELLSGNKTSSTATVDLNAVANAVIRGDYGNGTDRKKRLEAAGYNYQAVQDLVNKKLK